jgi:hypothetical protein
MKKPTQAEALDRGMKNVECTECGEDARVERYTYTHGNRNTTPRSPLVCVKCLVKTDRIDRDFTAHSLSPEKITYTNSMRESCAGLAMFIMDHVPEGREQSIALTKLEEVMFWANAGIARDK